MDTSGRARGAGALAILVTAALVLVGGIPATELTVLPAPNVPPVAPVLTATARPSCPPPRVSEEPGTCGERPADHAARLGGR